MAAWQHLWSVFGLSLTVLLALEWLWRTLWTLVEGRASPRCGCRCLPGKRGVARRALILGCVFAISAALTFAP